MKNMNEQFILADRSPFELRPPLDCSHIVDGQSLRIEADLPPGYYRCDVCTRSGAFDFSKLYIRTLFGGGLKDDQPNHPDAPVTGPWDFVNDRFLLPKPEVFLNGNRLGECWFDMPEIEECKTEQLHASFGFKVDGAGTQILKVSFRPDDGMRAADIIGVQIRRDERTPVRAVKLLRKGTGYPRLYFSQEDMPGLRRARTCSHEEAWDKFKANLAELRTQFDHPTKQSHGGSFMARAGMAWSSAGMFVLTGESEWLARTVEHAQPILDATHWGRQEPEMMGCDNDIVAGRTLFKMACIYDWLHGHAEETWLDALKDKILHHARIIYEFSIFQRDYWPTAYSQNHCWASLHGLVATGFLFAHASREAMEWLTWVRRIMDGYIGMQSQDGTGGCQADVCYGGQFFIRAAEIHLHNTDESLYHHPFYEHVSDYLDALHRLHYPAAAFAIARRTGSPAAKAHAARVMARRRAIDFLAYLWYQEPAAGGTEESLPVRWFPDGGHALFRTSQDPSLDLMFSCAGPLPRSVLGQAARYEGGHATPNMGQFTAVFGGDDFGHSFLCNAGRQTYRRLSRTANVITFDHKGQWGETFVWYPTLRPDQVGRLTEYTDRGPLKWAAAEMTAAYPPERGVSCWQRTVLHWRSDVFVIVDVVEADGPESTEWWCHCSGGVEAAGGGVFRCDAHQKRLWIKDLSPAGTTAHTGQTDYVPMPAVTWEREHHLCLQQKVAERNWFVVALSAERDALDAIEVAVGGGEARVAHADLGCVRVAKGDVAFTVGRSRNGVEL